MRLLAWRISGKMISHKIWRVSGCGGFKSECTRQSILFSLLHYSIDKNIFFYSSFSSLSLSILWRSTLSASRSQYSITVLWASAEGQCPPMVCSELECRGMMIFVPHTERASDEDGEHCHIYMCVLCFRGAVPAAIWFKLWYGPRNGARRKLSPLTYFPSSFFYYPFIPFKSIKQV